MPEITIKTQCGVETCDGCVFKESRIQLYERLETTKWCGLYHQRLDRKYEMFADFTMRLPACIAEHGKGER